jgi:hypothetical protein
MESNVGPRIRAGLLVTLLLLGAVGWFGVSSLPAAAASSVAPLTGNITGPTLIGTNSSANYYINGTGGPAFVDGFKIGTIKWHATVAGPNLTGVSVSPNSSTLSNVTPGGSTTLKVGSYAETLTLTVELTSSNSSSNQTLNLTYTIGVVVPYIVHATLVAGPASVTAFTVAVALDGSTVGNVSVPSIAANGSYNLTFRYASRGLSAGWHTFSISLAGEHGLVLFAGGALEYSQTFYVPGPPPDYAVWAVVGVVVFIGVLFILATRLAARRRPVSKR